MYILGINSVYHESSASLIKDGNLVVAIEEERFNRFKHGKELLLSNPNELPINSINYCLEFANISLADVEYIGFSINPKKRLETYLIDDFVAKGDWGSEEGETVFYNNILSVEEKLNSLGFRGTFYFIDHHKCHAASSFYTSPFDEATIVVFDGIGETATTFTAHGKENEINKIDENLYPNSIGFFWEKMCEFLGFSEYDSCKVMGLAAYGDDDIDIYNKMKDILYVVNNGKFKVNNEIMKLRKFDDFTEIEKHFGISRRKQNENVNQKHMKIAYALQKVTEEVIVSITDYAYANTKNENLCLSGGVALNCVANRKVLESGNYKQLYISSAPHDGGTSLGAALVIWHEYLNNNERNVINHAYWGPEFSNNDIELVLNEYQLNYELINNIEEKTAKLISDGNIVGWFQGALELGPRALGNRSLLADPRNYNMREKMNKIVKKREDFRPFAPSVLVDDIYNYFEVPFLTYASDFMLVTYPVKEEKRELIPAVIHVDGTSRIQAVKKEVNPIYYKLIEAFKAITGIGLLLNTSFNDREPIVCTPQDAIKTFLKTEINYLVLGNYLVYKSKSEGE